MNEVKSLKPYNLLYSNTSSTKIGSLPANSIITDIKVLVGTAFNAGNTDYLDIGDSEDADEFAANIDLSSTGKATVTMTEIGAVESTSNPTDIYVIYTGSGTAPSAGSAYIIVEYVQI